MEFVLQGENIRLGQLLKASGLAESGAFAKEIIQDGLVTVNGQVCTMRGKKIIKGDIIAFSGEKVEIV